MLPLFLFLSFSPTAECFWVLAFWLACCYPFAGGFLGLRKVAISMAHDVLGCVTPRLRFLVERDRLDLARVLTSGTEI